MTETLRDLMGSMEFDDSPMAAGMAALGRHIRVTPGTRIDPATGLPIKMSFREYVDHVNPKFIWHRHNIELAIIVQDVVDGKYGDHARIIIVMPPRHGKTEEISKLATSYWLYRFPEEWVALTTYGSDLSYATSKEAMAYYVAGCGDTVTEVESKDVLTAEAARHWRTTQGGGMWATGIGGPATGKGWNFGVIDDPVKNAVESQSDATGKRNTEWYQSVWYTREAPHHTASIIMHTRWPGPGDLIGWIFEQERADAFGDPEEASPEHWHVVLMSAIRDTTEEELRKELPPTVTIHADWRAMGEALCPERYDEKRLAKIKRRVGPYFWASIFQGRPRPREGGVFKRAWFRTISLAELRPGVDVRYWDMGASEPGGGGDPTVGVRFRWHGPNDYTILNVARFFMLPGSRDAEIRRVAEKDGMRVTQWGPQDPAAAGLAEAWHFRKNLDGFNVRTEPIGGNIEILAGPYQSALEVGSIAMLEGDWNTTFVDEHAAAWTGDHDDQIWAAAKAYLKSVRRRGQGASDDVMSYSYMMYGT